MVELVQRRTKRGCRDLWGADLLVKTAAGYVFFVQVKQGRKNAKGSVVKDLAGPIREYRKHGPWAVHLDLVVALCLDGDRRPRVFDVTARVAASRTGSSGS